MLFSSLLLRILCTLALAAAGGWAATALHTPLPWMIGPLLSVALACILGAPLHAPPGGRKAGQWAIGTALGLYFTPAVLEQLGRYAPMILIAAAGALAIGVACALLTRRLAGVDLPTAYFASLPGGASEMANLAERWGGAVDRIAAAHAVRMLLVVSVVPFTLSWSGAHGSDLYAPLVRQVDWARFPLLVGFGLVGVGLLRLCGIANIWVLGPLLGVGCATGMDLPLSALPGWVVACGQVLIASSLGTRFSREFFHAAPRFVSAAALGSVLALLLALGLALLLQQAFAAPLPTLSLATAPGGVAEMCITAKVLQLGVPLVTACHVVRVAVLTLGAQPLFRLLERWGTR